MNEMKPTLFATHVISYIAGLGSGYWLNKFLSGPRIQ
jgi:hypothetical protein